MQEVVSTFLVARPATLKVARQEPEPASGTRRGKRKRAVLESEEFVEGEGVARTTRSKSRKLAASQTSQSEAIANDDSDDDGSFEPVAPADDGLVECPLGCGKRLKIESVEPHLDRCEDEQKAESRARSRIQAPSPLRVASKAQERLSEPHYSMLNDNAMKKKLKDAGLANTGNKQLMIKRYKEWVNIWNANCDSSNPRSKRELLHDIDTWERTQGGRAHTSNMGAVVMRKDFDGQGWANSNRDEFSKLIADARRKRQSPVVEAVLNADAGKVTRANGEGDVSNRDGLNQHSSQSSAHSAAEHPTPAASSQMPPSLQAPTPTSPTKHRPPSALEITPTQAPPQDEIPAYLPEEAHLQPSEAIGQHSDQSVQSLPYALQMHPHSSPVERWAMYAMPSEAEVALDGEVG